MIKEPFRLIIAGSRDITDPAMLEAALICSGWREQISVVVCGMAPGSDMLGKAWAEANSIPVDEHPAQWSLHGKAAGPIRNKAMADAADALLALWDGVSPGTRNVISLARKRGAELRLVGQRFPVYVYTVEDYRRRLTALAWGKANGHLPERRRAAYEL